MDDNEISGIPVAAILNSETESPSILFYHIIGFLTPSHDN